jgi:aryl-alcohol dehydrogenase-like predicted oxidoreductase
MLDRISQSFEAMEEAIQKGQILSYGISSNSFSLPEEDKHFLPFYDLIDRAKEASKRVRKTENHGFAAVQMPANLLERGGLKTTAIWAKQNGLKVINYCNVLYYYYVN